MKHMGLLMSNGFLIGGLITSVGSIVDAVQNKALDAIKEGSKVSEQAREAYGIVPECSVGVFSQTISCVDRVPSALTREEEARVLNEYRAKVADEVKEIPGYEHATKDLVGIGVGLVALEAGMLLRPKRSKET